MITYKDKDIDVLLEVTPRIQPDSRIHLEVHPLIEEIIGYTGNSDFLQPITSTPEVITNISVKSEQTIILGDIPLLGYLFQSKNEEIVKTDLLIFITPEDLN